MVIGYPNNRRKKPVIYLDKLLNPLSHEIEHVNKNKLKPRQCCCKVSYCHVSYCLHSTSIFPVHL
uniref:Putative ovule protein n=1 Tax=Solanum chacoense TaxID=4108 RepID=A0A0V0H770_SOLCH